MPSLMGITSFFLGAFYRYAAILGITSITPFITNCTLMTASISPNIFVTILFPVLPAYFTIVSEYIMAK